MSTLTARLRPFSRACAQTTLSGIAIAGAVTFGFGVWAIAQESVIGIFAVPFGLSSCALAIDEIRRNARAS